MCWVLITDVRNSVNPSNQTYPANVGEVRGLAEVVDSTNFTVLNTFAPK